mmetsp:Transcript_40165/g.92916  ORF Transcript_40165/g.92916 Transcript_40165/m.92916 type:complete len:553 (+) Transcript_40165:32-1690(+)
MGTSPSRVLEIRLRPFPSQGTQFAEVNADGKTLHPGWGEPFRLPLSNNNPPDLIISVFSLLDGSKCQVGQANIALASLESLDLRPGGVAQPLRVLAGPTEMWVDVREVDLHDHQSSSFQFHLPSARRQAIALELQNAQMQHMQRMQRQMQGVQEVGEPEACATSLQPLKHRLLLERAYAQNAELSQQKKRVWKKLEHAKRVSCVAQLSVTSPNEEPEKWPGLQEELEKALSRQRNLRETCEKRIATTEAQLRQVADQGTNLSLSDTEAQALLAIATGRREELRRMCQECKDINKALGAPSIKFGKGLEVLSPEMEALQRQSVKQQADMARLQSELEEISQGDNYQGWQLHEEMSKEVRKLAEELEEISRAHQDDQVCIESEVIELKREISKSKDRLGDVLSELKQLEARAEMLRVEAPGSVSEHESRWLRECCRRAETELRELRQMEEVRQHLIGTLEQDQEKLIERISLATAKAIPGQDAREAEGKVLALEQRCHELQESIKLRQTETLQMRQQAQQIMGQIEILQQTYSQLQCASDERVLRDPQPQMAMA